MARVKVKRHERNITSRFIEEKIEGNKTMIQSLMRENDALVDQSRKVAGVKGIFSWVGYGFESSSGTTQEWLAFVRDFKNYIKSNLPLGAELVNFSRGHFYVSGFIKRGDKYVYFSTNDVRYYSKSWHDSILIRTAQNDKDYAGGSNGYTTLQDFKESVWRLFDRGW